MANDPQFATQYSEMSHQKRLQNAALIVKNNALLHEHAAAADQSPNNCVINTVDRHYCVIVCLAIAIICAIILIIALNLMT